MNSFSFDFSLILDPLSLFFIFTILLVTIPAFIFSFGYLKDKYSTKKIIFGQLLLAVFVVSMLLVVSVRNALAFLVVWELMTMLSFLFVFYEHDNEKSVQAGTIYIVMSQLGTALIMAGIFILYKYTGTFDLPAMKSALVSAPFGIKNLLFFLFFFGFGAKAGIVPLHIWLPYAHPQAPSHVSALMSGVMIKTAIYGLLRFVLFMFGAASLWWGSIILVFAAVSCLVGIIYALMEHDIKTLLAYSSVENMGIILLGVGASMVFLRLNLPILSALALTAGLYHLINHAAFKGLLFLCAGSVYKATGTRNMEKMGGLIHNLPLTAGAFLIGAMAISALPPLNGFVSEWLTLQVLFLGALKLSGGLKIFLGICAAVLALTGGLAAACFVKAFGIIFLAKPRSKKVEQATEVSWPMHLGTGLLSLTIIILGLGAVWVIKLISRVSGFLVGTDLEGSNLSLNNFTLSLPAGQGIYLSPFILLVILAAVAALAFAAINLIFGRQKRTVGATWDCGYYRLTPRNEYTATGFSKPFRLAFSFFLLPFKKVEQVKESRYHIKSFTYETSTTKIFREYFYKNFIGAFFATGKRMRGLQAGSIQLYLGYIFLALLVLLALAGKI